MVWIEKTGPDTYEEEHSVGDYQIKIYRQGRKKDLDRVEVKRGLFRSKTITDADVDKINSEIEKDAFPTELGVLVDGTALGRDYLAILDYCRKIGWLPELKNLEIIEKE